MQTHFNRDVSSQFFQVSPGDSRVVTLERVKGTRLVARSAHPLVYSESNMNCKLELDYSPATAQDYPTDGRCPIVVMVELDTRTFRYKTLMPDDAGFGEMLSLNESQPSVGRGHRRVITTLDEIELRWPSAGLRQPT